MKTYTPKPIDTSDVKLSKELEGLTELLAKNVHEVWSESRMSQGWTYGKDRNDEKKTHPCLVEYEALTDVEKAYDRDTAMQTLKLISKLDYKVEAPTNVDLTKVGHELKVTTPEDYKPSPIDTSNVKLNKDLEGLSELLSKNVHEVWSESRISQGWTYGAERNDDKKTHPCLVEYEKLTDVEKAYDRDTAMQTLKIIDKLGYKIEEPNKGIALSDMQQKSVLSQAKEALGELTKDKPAAWQAELATNIAGHAEINGVDAKKLAKDFAGLSQQESVRRFAELTQEQVIAR